MSRAFDRKDLSNSILIGRKSAPTGTNAMRFSLLNPMPATAKMSRLAGILLLSSLIPAQALACACGCA
ncbi:MAG: hypothetical protein WCC41_06490, partial [Rhodomicrobium sp.]